MSDLEETMALQIRAAKLPIPEREYRFHPVRRWRSDFAWPEKKVLLEIEGGHWNGGRHTRGGGFDNDCNKYAIAVLMGWRVFRATSTHIKSGEALKWIEEILK